MMENEKLYSFERAFASGTSGCRNTCSCGVEYYDNEDSSWSWEEGELEELQENPKAVGLPHSAGTLIFENEEFVSACSCWHARAEVLMKWMDAHGSQIAKYFSLEKQRKKEVYEAAPVIVEEEVLADAKEHVLSIDRTSKTFAFFDAYDKILAGFSPYASEELALRAGRAYASALGVSLRVVYPSVSSLKISK